MQRRLIINLGLLFAITILIVILKFASNQDNPVAEVHLTQLQPEQINQIKITRNKNDVILMKRVDNHWMMQQPVNAPANEYRINTLLKLVDAYSYSQFKINETDLKQFQLDNPAVVVQLNNTDIAFGDTSPLGKQRYVMVDQVIHLINDSLFQQLQAPATFYVDNKILPEKSAIHKIIFNDIQIEAVNGIWQITPQQQISADDIVSVVQEWKMLTAITVKLYDKTQPLIQKVTVGFENGDQTTLDILAMTPDLLIGNPETGLEYIIGGEYTDKLFISKTVKAN